MERIEKKIIIIGAGRAGRLLDLDIKKNYHSYRVIGFLDDVVRPGGFNVLGRVRDCQKIANRHSVDEMVIAIPSADGNVIRKIILANLSNRIPLKIVPRSQRVIGESDVRYAEVKSIEPEDFLGRPFTNKNVDRLRKFYKGKVVFVTGGAGSIGSEIVHQLLDLDVKRVVVYDNSEYLIFMLEQRLIETGQRNRCDLIIGSILNRGKVDHLFKMIRPDIIFHAAAYKHVHLMQDNADESVSNNVIGTKRVIDAAIRHGIATFTFVSTDKVVNPTSVMGATKKLGEYYINSLKSGTRFHIVRFGNVINSNGSVLPLFERQINLYSYVTLTHKKMKRYFMSIREAAQLVIESTASNKRGVVHLLNMGELIKVYEVALCLIRSKNLMPNEDVKLKVTGLRSGEKLVEELYTEQEKRHISKTRDNRIFSLKREGAPPFEILSAIAALEEGVRENGDQGKLRKTLKRLFPSLKLPSR